jgi:hypothetical protein
MLPNHHIKNTAAIALALAAITPAAAAAKLIGAGPFGETPQHHAQAHNRPIPFCGAVLDPMTGQEHGGCPPGYPNLDHATR